MSRGTRSRTQPRDARANAGGMRRAHASGMRKKPNIVPKKLNLDVKTVRSLEQVTGGTTPQKGSLFCSLSGCHT
jgi:hypothetical protein